MTQNVVYSGQVAQDAITIIKKFRPEMTFFRDTYRQIHSMPELSGQEAETARIVSNFLETLGGFTVHTGIGGHGIAAVLSNGDGPCLLLRADMDALPMLEQTNLPYASERTMASQDGPKPVMHACGHDAHVACLMATAQLLFNSRAYWRGTLICVFQPAEETLSGANAMIADRLFDKIPKPDIVLVQHLSNGRTGKISSRSGTLLTASESLSIRIFGHGGHGGWPHQCIDPVNIGCSIVLQLQTLVSREVEPGKLAIITCGSIHAGETAGTIPNHLDLKVTLRALDDATHTRLLASIKRIVEAECRVGGTTRAPLIETTRSSGATINDDNTFQVLKNSFVSYFGTEYSDMEIATATEDVHLLASAAGAPLVMWFFGGSDAAQWDNAERQGTLEELPMNHSPFFAPNKGRAERNNLGQLHFR
ncbi:hypothetical protein NLG97_g3650 [Lecanicillium saksenae]|uniref:Uncharacterized protein n=1 Tax=Lecanicillium saksenae TaxID=468837 RepID=A0ACC1QXQ6_9HYPO|nr:hypothetical protein NLG97_g3650 [Lecanicillium saksenae]